MQRAVPGVEERVWPSRPAELRGRLCRSRVIWGGDSLTPSLVAMFKIQVTVGIILSTLVAHEGDTRGSGETDRTPGRGPGTAGHAWSPGVKRQALPPVFPAWLPSVPSPVKRWGSPPCRPHCCVVKIGEACRGPNSGSPCV